MLEDNNKFATDIIASDESNGTGDKLQPKTKATPATKTKLKKPKPQTTTGPIYLLLHENGKYKELRESELQVEAAGVFKEPTLRLVKAQFLIPELSFRLAEE